MAAEPKCLIFDEATNGFDLPLRKKIIEEIVDLQRKLAFTLIFITHDMELAVVIADVILVMRNSTLIEQVEFLEIYQYLQANTARRFICEWNY